MSESAERQQFEDFMRRILRVPKRKIDAMREVELTLHQLEREHVLRSEKRSDGTVWFLAEEPTP